MTSKKKVHVEYVHTDLRNHVELRLGNGIAVVVATTAPLTEAIYVTASMAKRLKIKPSLGGEYD